LERKQQGLAMLADRGMIDEMLHPLLACLGKGDYIDVLDLSRNPRLGDSFGRELLETLSRLNSKLGEDFSPPHTILLNHTGISSAVFGEVSMLILPLSMYLIY
jgi:hypothetical protein